MLSACLALVGMGCQTPTLIFDVDPSAHDPCTPNPCPAQGTCQSDTDAEAFCSCDIGWDGPLCDRCSLGYSGEHCDTSSVCQQVVGAAERTRFVVTSHPYSASGGQDTRFRVWELSETGQLTDTGKTFSMGRATGPQAIRFTPDGEIGVAVHTDGGLGIFRLDAKGVPTVIETDFKGQLHPFYAQQVTLTRSGDRLLVIDNNWANNGGGIYALRLECDGTITEEGLLLEAKQPQFMYLLGNDEAEALLVAKSVPLSTFGHDSYLLNWGQSPSLLAGVDAFGDDDYTIAGSTMTLDGRYVLMADNNEFYSESNRVAVVEIGAVSLQRRQILTDIQDPVAMVMSPFDNAVLISSGYGNKVIALSYNFTQSTSPFTLEAAPAYEGAAPQLPAGMVVIERGNLMGLVLLAENTGVRQLYFTALGTVEDAGLVSLGPGFQHIVGAVGVQP
jgi:hypothetical protein